MMDASWLVHAAIGLLPALCFLAALVLLDSYKLVRLRMVLAMIGVGGVVAGIVTCSIPFPRPHRTGCDLLALYRRPSRNR